jgi:hypothetical protein
MHRLITTLLLLACSSVALAGDPYEPPRNIKGKPYFNGVWQVLNTANYNLEPHGAQAALVFREGPVRQSGRASLINFPTRPVRPLLPLL